MSTPFPGSKPLVQHVRAPQKSNGEWDTHPQLWKVNGTETEMFNIGALSMATGFKPVTLRRWEDEGILPQPLFRSPKPTGPQAQGSTAGRRLYSRQQIELVVKGIELFKIRQARKGKADWKGLTKYLLIGWNNL